MTAPEKFLEDTAVPIKPPIPAMSAPSSTTMTYTELGAPVSMAASIPASAFGSCFGSFLRSTVTAKPANLVGKIGLMWCVMYIFFPVICSRASETEAASTWRKASRSAASSVGAEESACRALAGEDGQAMNVKTSTPSKDKTVATTMRRKDFDKRSPAKADIGILLERE